MGHKEYGQMLMRYYKKFLQQQFLIKKIRHNITFSVAKMLMAQ
jgi:hypothetical protein